MGSISMGKLVEWTMKPFDYINAINNHSNVEDYYSYSSFLTNRTFSYFTDTIYVANEMNRRHHLDKELQFKFFINMVRPKKRFAKWSKTEHTDNVEVIREYYKYSYEKAKQAVVILSDEQINEIRKKLYKGGLK